METSHFPGQRPDPNDPEKALLKGQILSRLALRLSNLQSFETVLYRMAQFPVPLLADWCVLDVEDEGIFSRKHVIFGDSTQTTAADRLRAANPAPSDEDHPRILRNNSLLAWNLSAGVNWRWGVEIPIRFHSRNVFITFLKYDDPGMPDDSWYLEVAQEISQLCRMALQSSNTLQSVSEKLRQQDQTRSVVSHELNNSLSLLNLQLEILAQWLRKNSALPEKLDKMVSDMQLQARSMPRQIQDLLRLSSNDRSEISVHIEKFELDGFVSQILSQYEAMLKKSGITWSIDMPRALVVALDPFRMREVLTNFLTNSMKYAPGSTVSISARRSSDQLLLEYSDSGPGMPTETNGDTFSPFHRLSSQHQSAPGTGLGLYIVKTIVIAHQGTISVSSSHGLGTKFTICFPESVLP